MATQQELIREHEMLTELGVPPVKVWSHRCIWYNPDGSVNSNLSCDFYSRLLYLGRGLRPSAASMSVAPRAKIASTKLAPESSPVVLIDAVINMMRDRETWEGIANALLSMLIAASGKILGY